jgi:release factor glutamine methyltransferase
MVTDEDALLDLLRELQSRDYQFTCVTPATHERVLANPSGGEPSLQDIFGWNRSFTADQLAPELLSLLDRANCVERSEERLRSQVRVASLAKHLFLHSSFPTSSADAVFFGPDTYRFVRFVRSHLGTLDEAQWLVDMGAGSGAGGIAVAALLPSARVSLVDINPAAAQLARVNAGFAGLDAEFLLSDNIPTGCDAVIANPPYMMDASHRTYRDGGGMLGGEVACQWVSQALRALVPGGTMLLYTGAAFTRGRAPLLETIASLCSAANAELGFEELDPDVFGDELVKDSYRGVERIAAVGISIELQD